MLNLFAATGHLHYAKSARMYLQQMLDLPFKYRNLHRQFVEHGYFTKRRSDRLWAGLWSDLVIEQVMMRSVKGRGGLTRRRGFSESTRLQWVLTAHECAVIHETMTSITSLHLISSKQHTEMGKERRKTDQTDEKKVSSWIQNHNSFTISESLNGSLKALHLVSSQMNQLLSIVIKPSQMVKKSRNTFTESNWSRPKLHEKMELLLLIQ